MFKKSIFCTIIFTSLLTAVLLLSPGKVTRGKEPVPSYYLPVTINLKPLTPFLVKDINSKTPSSFIYCPQALGQYMICSAYDQVHGYELWRHNGEEGGASFLKDISPQEDSYAMHERSATARLKNEILFTADSGFWKTDGTTQGTVLLKGQFWSLTSEEPLTVGNDLVYFLANDGDHGLELWRSDGREGGTKMVKDIWPGPQNRGIYSLTPLGEKLYFIVEGENYYTLWVSDNTTAGTKQVPAVSQWPVTHIAALDDFLILNAHDVPSEPSSLYRTDGTEVGTERISDYGAHRGLDPREFASLESLVVFIFSRANYEGWGVGSSDGTTAGTQTFGQSNDPSRSPRDLFAAGSQAFFFEERHAEDAYALWRTDGTAGGTRLLRIFKEPYEISRETALVAGSELYFPAEDGTHGRELWVSDGTVEGTHMVSDIVPGAKSSYPRPGVFFKERLYFSATDMFGDEELWRTDGTESGTVRADDVIDFPTASSFPSHIAAQPHGIYLRARTGDEIGLWRSDGTKLGTSLVKSFGSNAISDPLHSAEWVMAGGNLYLISESPDAIWRSNGTEAGTVPLSGPEECDLPNMLAAVGDKVFHFANARGQWLCLTGSPHVKIKYLDDTVVDVVPAESLLFYRFSSGRIGVSDGTPAGTLIYNAPVLTIGPSYPMAAIGDTLYFNGCTAPARDCELWKLEGLNGPPQRVADGIGGPDGSNPKGLAALNDRLVYTAVAGTFGPLLWVSDGTAEGTWPTADVMMCGGPQYGSTSAVVGDELYFAGIDSLEAGSRGCELWVTNGTYQGTRLVKDIVPGPNSSIPGALTAAGAHVIFTADDGAHGCELWASDGSAQGTFMIPGWDNRQADPEALGRAGSCPEGLTVSNGKLYYSDYGAMRDNELWALLTVGR